jgi:DNA-binding MarR family transcriptional regulator|tara:strand:+ start:942 stop:1508 length:567 start_codon:yes stop_codon:yes gene_type:complete
MLETETPKNLSERDILAAIRIDTGVSLPIPAGKNPSTLKRYQLEVIRLLATLHKRFLDEIKSELDRLGVDDINNTQALLLAHIGDESPTISELIHRGYYVGSNISYNVKKLIENGYLISERSFHDRRSTRVRLSERAHRLVEFIEPLFELHGHPFQSNDLDHQVMAGVIDKLRMLERFWPLSAAHSGR